ncbi:MAG: hypothetical protein ACI9O6_002974 [Glaciecola sp.]|jgi:hypothetical protein
MRNEIGHKTQMTQLQNHNLGFNLVNMHSRACGGAHSPT